MSLVIGENVVSSSLLIAVANSLLVEAHVHVSSSFFKAQTSSVLILSPRLITAHLCV